MASEPAPGGARPPEPAALTAPTPPPPATAALSRARLPDDPKERAWLDRARQDLGRDDPATLRATLDALPETQHPALQAFATVLAVKAGDPARARVHAALVPPGGFEHLLVRLTLGEARGSASTIADVAPGSLCDAADLGRVLHSLKRWDEAFGIAVAVRTAVPSCEDAWEVEARTLLGRGDFEGARDAAKAGLAALGESRRLTQVRTDAEADLTRLAIQPYDGDKFRRPNLWLWAVFLLALAALGAVALVSVLVQRERRRTTAPGAFPSLAGPIAGVGLAAAFAVLAWLTWGLGSNVAIAAAPVILVATLGAFVFRGVRAGGLASGRAPSLYLASFLVSLTTLLLLLIVLRGDYHRLQSHAAEEDPAGFDAETGWWPPPSGPPIEGERVGENRAGQRRELVEENRPQVVLIGDSVAYGWGTKHDEHWMRLLAPSIPSVQLLNGAVSGYSIDQYLLALRRYAKQTKPKLFIVFVYTGNDWDGTNRSQFSGHSKPFFRMDGDRMVEWNPVRSRLNCIDVLAGSLSFKLLWHYPVPAERFLMQLCNAPRNLPPDDTQVVAGLFRAIEEAGRDAGAPVLFGLSPDRLDWEQGWFQRHSPHPQFRKLLEQGNHRFFDLKDTMADDARAAGLEPPPSQMMYVDGGHYNAKGMKVLAGRMRLVLKEAGIE